MQTMEALSTQQSRTKGDEFLLRKKYFDKKVNRRRRRSDNNVDGSYVYSNKNKSQIYIMICSKI